MFKDLNLKSFKSKESINLDENNLLTEMGLQIINKAIKKSGIKLNYLDIGLNIPIHDVSEKKVIN